ncbi:NAD(+)-dependent glutamate dehydrogenase [Frankliniella fusca]|uniref:NAD(+)-dependent glutamate dehydrogenase n=1 Tax=Frankliniella fusca TaxID=407009 RepID=A0AAE1H6N2_9NEOP|nr:NAD(+)-dependent glutamate dehydrogenase [Frankliniella fusca]
MKSLTAVALALFVLLSLAQQDVAVAKDPCSKDWLRYMVVQQCGGMDKRHLDRRKPLPTPSLHEILEEVDEEFERWRLGLASPLEYRKEKSEDVLVLVPAIAENRVSLNDTSDKLDVPAASAPTTRGFFKRLFEHPGDVLAEAMGLSSREPNNRKLLRRRAMMNGISKCCSEDCDPEDFEGACY